MGFWFEAWTLPHETPHQRKIAYIPIVSASVEDAQDKTRARGSIVVPAAFSRLAEIINVDDDDHSNDIGSLIVVFHHEHLGVDGWPTPLGAFYADRVSDDLTSVATSTVEISGDWIDSSLNHVTTYPFDFPTYPSLEDDWIWGGDDILSDGGFEDPAYTNEIQRISLNGADGGTFRLQSPLAGAEWTDPLQWDVNGDDLRQEIVNEWAGVLDVRISGSGQNTDPWIIEFIEPGGVLLPGLIVAEDLTLTNVGPEGIYVNREPGGQTTDGAWERTFLYESGIELGEYTTWEYNDERVRTGDYAFKINGSGFPGIQKRIQVIAGHRYSAGVWLNPDLADKEFRLVIRGTVNEDLNLIASSGFSGAAAIYPADTWSLMDAGTFVPHVSDIIWRAAYVGSGNSGDFWLDDAFLAPGDAATTVGDILLQLWNDAATDHLGARGTDGVLGWLVPTFDEDVDSNGDAWDSARSMFVSVNDQLGEVVQQLISKWGYRNSITYDKVAGEWQWNVYNPGSPGYFIDQTGTHDYAIVLGKSGFTAGPLVRRAPMHTGMLGVADGGVYVNAFDSVLEGVWGRREAGDDFGFMSTVTDLTDAVVEAQRLAEDGMTGISIKLSPLSSLVPLVHIKPGYILPVHLGDKHPWKSREVHSCRVDIGEWGRTTQMSVSLGSDVFGSMGFAGLAEGVRRLLTKLKREKKQFGSPVASGGGRAIPWLVAASNSPQVWKDAATYICSGINDEVQIMAAIVEAEGYVGLAPGDYWVESVTSNSPINLGFGSTGGCILEGLGGAYGALINQSDTGKTTPGPLVKIESNCGLRNVAVGTNDCDAVGIQGGELFVDNCSLLPAAGHRAINTLSAGSGFVRISGNTLYRPCRLQGNYFRVYGNFSIILGEYGFMGDDPAWELDDCHESTVTGNVIAVTRNAAILITGAGSDNNAITGNHIEGSDAGIKLADSAARNTITGNEISGVRGHGIILDAATDNTVTGNLISQPGEEDNNTYDGIHLVGNADRNSVQGNTVIGAPANATRYGINVSAATCDRNLVADNWLGEEASYGTASYNDAGTGTITARDGNGQFTY